MKTDLTEGKVTRQVRPRGLGEIIYRTCNLKEKFETNFAESFQFAIFFANLVQQLKFSVVGPDELSVIVKLIEHSSVEFKTKSDLLDAIATLNLPEAPNFEALYHKALQGDVDLEGKYLLRVAPMKLIIEALEFPEEWDIQQAMIDDLEFISRSDVTPFERDARETILINRFGSQKFEEFTEEWPMYLKEYDDFLIECIADDQRSIGLGPRVSVPPKFVSTIDESTLVRGALEQGIFEGDQPIHKSADWVRDTLGLDGYSPSYRGALTQLGFMIFKPETVVDPIAKRPTVFDATSDYRFFGACDGNRVCDKYGLTANLEKISENLNGAEHDDISGVRELVLNNPPIAEGRKVVVGYLGTINAPRRDHNAEDGSINDKMKELHHQFLTKHLDGEDPVKILDEILGWAA